MLVSCTCDVKSVINAYFECTIETKGRDMMVGVIDVGGGLRGIYGTAIFDYCLDKGVSFDYCIGVSAGSANIASFLGKQKGRNRKFYLEYTFRKAYMSMTNFIKKGSYIDLDYVYSVLSNGDGEYPLNYDEIAKSESVMKVVAADALTGETKYFDKSHINRDNYHILKASSAIPAVCRPYIIDGVPYYDGGIADPVPIAKAIQDGCEKVVVILTRPIDFIREQKNDVWPAKLVRRKYPRAAQNMLMRYKKYNDGVALAKEYEKEGKALIIAPDDCCGVDTLTKDRSRMEKLYEKGYNNARSIIDFLKK